MKKPCAVFTIVYNERYLLPIWLRHYSNYFAPEDIYVLDNDSDDGSTEGTGFNRVIAHNDHAFDHQWLNETVRAQQCKLLEEYEFVLFSEVDEIVCYDPEKYGSFSEMLTEFKSRGLHCTRCYGHEIVQHIEEEAPIDLNNHPILRQRKYWYLYSNVCKPYLSDFALEWGLGFHGAWNYPVGECEFPDLYLLHLHYMDLQLSIQRNFDRLTRNKTWKPGEGFAVYNSWANAGMIEKMHRHFIGPHLVPIPERFKEII